MTDNIKSEDSLGRNWTPNNNYIVIRWYFYRNKQTYLYTLKLYISKLPRIQLNPSYGLYINVSFFNF